MKIFDCYVTDNGYYMYTEVTGKSEGDTATLISKDFSQKGQACLVFWYYFYGLHVGQLYVTLTDNSKVTTVFDTAGMLMYWINSVKNVLRKEYG